MTFIPLSYFRSKSDPGLPLHTCPKRQWVASTHLAICVCKVAVSLMLECAAVFAGRNLNPFSDVLFDKRHLMDGGQPPRGPPAESETAGFTEPPFTDSHEGGPHEETAGLPQIVKSILDREGCVANVIHRLSYQVDCDSELSQRARSYALELRHHLARLRALLPHGAGPAPEGRLLESKLKSAIDGLQPDDAKLVLIRFLLRHAGTQSEILPSASDRPKARTLEMLQRRAERERQRIALWLNEHEAGLHQRSGRRPRTGGDFRRRNSETVLPTPHGDIFDRHGPFGDSARARSTVFWKDAPEMSG